MTKLTKEQIAVLDDVILYTATYEELAERARASREATTDRLHKEAIRLKDIFDRTGSASDEAAYIAAFDRWIDA